MNTFIIYRDCAIIFNRARDSSPSLEDISTTLSVIESHKFSSLGYRIDIIHENNHKKITGLFYNVHKFFDYLIDLCEERDRFGVVLYLNH